MFMVMSRVSVNNVRDSFSGITTRAKLAERQPFENGDAKTLYVSVPVCLCVRASVCVHVHGCLYVCLLDKLTFVWL